jgi:hypothetical protein
MWEIEFLVAMTMNTALLWEVTPYNLVGSYRHFEDILMNFCQVSRRHI